MWGFLRDTLNILTQIVIWDFTFLDFRDFNAYTMVLAIFGTKRSNSEEDVSMLYKFLSIWECF